MTEENDTWARLVMGLTAATKGGSLEWKKKSVRTGSGLDLSRTIGDAFGGRKIYSANSRNALYDLASGDAFGGAPYQLTVWEVGPRPALKPTVEMESSVDASEATLNSALKNLFKAVEMSIEPPDEVVNRLLEGL